MRARISKRSPAPGLVQGAFFVATGLWPIVHMRSFERATGPKAEHWLVRTMGGLIAVIGGTLIASALDRRSGKLAPALGMSSAAALALSDVIYARRGVISKVYLADAAVELTLLSLWLARRGD